MCFQKLFGNLLCCGRIFRSKSDEELLNATLIGSQLFQEASLVHTCTTTIDVTPGTSFIIKGYILKNCERFAINLTLGLLHQDIALHINPRLPQNYIVRNSKINNRWGREETTSALPFVLQRGDSFAIQILITETDFYISVNGQHFASYAHRIPYERITTIQVIGDVSDVEVEQIPVQEYPDKQHRSLNNVVKSLDTVNEMDFYKGEYLHLPYYGKLLEKFVPGTRLHVIGRVKVLPHSFYVNLQRGDMMWPHPTIAFHLNPRFNNAGKHVIVNNAWLDEKWGKEERNETYTDFMPSRSFNMCIDCTDSSYAVYLNRKQIAEFKFRLQPEIVDTIYIQGDIKLQAVTLETSPEQFDDLDI